MRRDKDLSVLVSRDPFTTKRKGKKRTVQQHEVDMVFIAELYLKGFTHRQIVDELNSARVGLYSLSYTQIKADIGQLHSRWISSYLVNFDQAKARELAHIDKLEQEYWTAWSKSQLKIEETESEQIKDQQGVQRGNMPSYARTRVKKKEINRDGDSRFLLGVQWCIEQRCKIFGLTVVTMNQNINVNWRKEAEAQGVDPDGVQNELVEQFLSAAKTGLARSGNAGSMGESPKDTQGPGPHPLPE